jgi:glycogen phosphorylase
MAIDRWTMSITTRNSRLCCNSLGAAQFSRGDADVFRPLVDNLRYDDPFLVLADYASYVECQGRVSAAWQDADAWTRMSILNTARSGKFSSDRAIAEYCDEIWNVRPVTVKVER